jgi:hypothetical protein
MDYDSFRTRKEDFAELYRNAEESMPHWMPLPRGCCLIMTPFVDASHAAKKKTGRSHTGYVVLLNRAPIFWYNSNWQHTIDTSAFSSEFIALKACLEAVEDL